MEKNVQSFVWKNIICRFKIPRVLVSDNDKQFDNDTFRDFCQQLRIKNHYSSPIHPQANKQVEVTNKSLLKIIKTRLKMAKGIWPDELPSVLWAYRTMACTLATKPPFRLTYRHEVIIPTKVGLTSYRMSHHDKGRNEEGMRLQLDLLNDVRAMVEQRITRYQDLLAKHYNTKTTKDTNEYLFLEILLKSYLRGGQRTRDTDKYSVLY
nr:uncharacterized protein LOC111992259 [Quercus suber]